MFQKRDHAKTYQFLCSYKPRKENVELSKQISTVTATIRPNRYTTIWS